MEIDELETRWRTLDRRLDTSLRLSARLIREMGQRRVGSALGRLSWSVSIELILHVAAVLWLGSYTVDHIPQIRFAAPGMVLWLAAIALIGSSVTQLVRLSELRFDAPILTMQTRLERLRAHRLREVQWALLLSPLLWLPLLIVLLHGLLRIDLYALVPAEWIWGNILFGVVAIPLFPALARGLSQRVGNAPWLQRLLDDVAGRSVTDARRALAELDAFEDEPADG